MRVVAVLLLITFALYAQPIEMHTPRNIQPPNDAADFWAQWSSVNPRVALFVKITPQSFWTGASAIGFTSNTRDMTLPGHVGITFKSAPGITPTLVDQVLGETASIDMQGVYQTGIFEQADVIAGKWNFAEIEVFSASWQNTDLGELVHFKGNLGEFKDYQLFFTAEGRGLIGRLSRDVDDKTQRLCRVAEFGNARCGKVLTGSFEYNATSDVAGAVITETAHGMTTGEPVRPSVTSGAINPELTAGTGYYVIRLTADTFSLATTYANARAGTALTLTDAVGIIKINRGQVIVGGVSYDIKQLAVEGNSSISVAGLVFDTSTFAGNVPVDSAALALYAALLPNGTITARSGPNNGVSREISGAAEATGGHPFMFVEMKRPFPYAIDVTTDFDITFGCRRTLEDCRKFTNALNFQGEPFIPNIENANRITSAR